MRVLKGAEVSAKIKEEVQAALAKCKGAAPKLAIIRVGENPDDMSYERGATKKMENFGLRVQSYVYPADITDADFKAEFTKINEDPDVTGILMLRPLPKQICEKDIEGMIDPAKDLDGISPVNIAKIFEGDDSGFAPCTAEAVIEVLKAAEIPMTGKRVTIVGRSMVVGKPLSMLMVKENATVTICHTRTKDMPSVVKEADIVIVAAGRAGVVDDTYLRAGQTVIDVGINVNEEGKLCGDVAYAKAEPIVEAITPVPGGVGSVTTSVLVGHVVEAAMRKNS